jgi:hypothetical protein
MPPGPVLNRNLFSLSRRKRTKVSGPYNVTFSATFSGDTRVAAGSVSHGVRVRAEVSQSLTGYYGTSASYRLYTGSRTRHLIIWSTTIVTSVSFRPHKFSI